MKREIVWYRRILPLALVVAWLGLASVGGPFFGKIGEVSSNDLSTFLPKTAESTVVKEKLEKFQAADTIPAIVVFESDNRLTESQQTQLDEAQRRMQQTGMIKGSVSPAIYSDDEKAAFMLVPLDSNQKLAPIIDTLKQAVSDSQTGVHSAFTGPAMLSRDLNKAFSGIDGTLLIVALSVVFLILLVVYRSPVLPIITLLSSMVALASAIVVVWYLAKADIVQLNGQVQGILFILVIGAATDYALLYIARYREELLHAQSTWKATKSSLKATWEPIVAAGGTVTLGLLCLLVSDLGSNKALGPVGGIGIMFAILTSLTFLPALLQLLGRSSFWPRRPQYTASKASYDYRKTHPMWAKVGRLVSRHPRRLWIGIVVALLACCLYVPHLKAQGVSQQDLIIGKSEARDGQKMLDEHFPAGSGSPAFVVVPIKHHDAVVSIIEKDRGVDAVSVMTTDKQRPVAPVGNSSFLPSGLSAKVVNGNEVLQVTLKDVASSVAARDTIQRLRNATESISPKVMFGGVSAIQLDTNTASNHDLRLIIPLILVAITFVLMVLLRSLIAPLVLLVTTVISFGSALGVAALLFNHVWHFPGADPSVIIFGFVFLVALGIDYNIFLMTRVREETIKLGVRKGTLKALVVTGGVITSAGVVLASTFAALYVIPILFLAQIAFIVAFGVLLDTLIVRSLLVPALTLEIGKLMWWPSRLSKKGKSS